ncbi:uncharacterized protein LOC127122378 [Lathyrus oleraceus]|uniref:uncharacterized protein LOC127122378 n=1 Tax=Pisum sativum TaxID=3888 RepID=UPI0021D11042|nr:uncharacterized protein LOC127122378 [Pisum sativum]
MPILVAPVNDQQYHMPPGFPWGMPHCYMPTRYHPQNAEAPIVTVVMYVPSPVVHTTHYNEENVYHAAPSEVVGVDEMLEGFQDQFLEMQMEINALRGKDLFGKTASELCLVPNVQILPKFKVLDFDKYKGNSCPQSHLVMYARNMSTQTDNHQLLIHYFQDSLTGVVLKWWRRIAAHICLPLEEKDMTKTFLKTLSSFYYDCIIASAPSDFTEMVNMGMRLEEAAREGRLTKEAGASSHVKKFTNNFSKKKESDVSVISYGRQRRKYQHVIVVSPVISPPMVAQCFSHNSRININNKLFPALLAKNHVYTRSPPPVPKDLPYWYKANQFCAHHQEAPGHNIENYFGLKSNVQRLIKSGILSFKDINPNVQVNPLPQHGSASVNMVYGCPGNFRIYDVRLLGENLVKKHARYNKNGFMPPHNYAACRVLCSRNSQTCLTVVTDLQDQMVQGYIVAYQARDYNQVNMVNSDNEVNVIVPQFNDSEPIQITYDSRRTSMTPLVINLTDPVPY